jgi:dihydroflavonol-4-reductase
MNVLVLGGTGHLGNAIVRELLARHCTVTIVNRHGKATANTTDLPVRFVAGDLSSLEKIGDWMPGHDVVVDAAAPYPFQLLGGDSEAEQQPLAHAERRTTALLNAAQHHQARIAYVSSFTTQIRSDQVFARWRAQMLRPLHAYFTVKSHIETRILAAARNGLAAVVVNPTMCLGPWELKPRALCLIPRLLRNEVLVSTSHMLNVIDVRDVATGLVAALEHERYGEPIVLSGHNITSDELFGWICRLGETRPPRFSAPASLSAFASYGIELGFAVMGQPSPVPSLVVALLCEHQWLSPSIAQRELGVVPHPLSGTLRDAIAWYRQIGYC